MQFKEFLKMANLLKVHKKMKKHWKWNFEWILMKKKKSNRIQIYSSWYQQKIWN